MAAILTDVGPLTALLNTNALKDLTIANGLSTNGGAICNNGGAVSLTNWLKTEVGAPVVMTGACCPKPGTRPSQPQHVQS